MKHLAIIGAIALAGCVQDPQVDGRQTFADNCAACHGADGRGDGELARQMSKTPPDLTVLSAKNGGVFPRDYVMSTIDGYRRPGSFAPDMPMFGEADMGETVMIDSTPVPARLYALALYIESIQRPAE